MLECSPLKVLQSDRTLSVGKRKINDVTTNFLAIQKNSDEFFNASEHAVKQARKLKKKKGILATPSFYYREGLDKETKSIIEFYDRDDVSRMCPGNCISIRNKDGSKEKV